MPGIIIQNFRFQHFTHSSKPSHSITRMVVCHSVISFTSLFIPIVITRSRITASQAAILEPRFLTSLFVPIDITRSRITALQTAILEPRFGSRSEVCTVVYGLREIGAKKMISSTSVSCTQNITSKRYCFSL